MTRPSLHYFSIGLALLLVSCATARAVWHMPAQATREAPPPGLETRALSLEQKAPDFELTDQSKKTHALATHRASGPVVLVFYRGFW